MTHLLNHPATWTLAAFLPASLVLLMAVPALRPWVVRAGPFAALPAFSLSLLAVPDRYVAVPWMLLETRFGLDETSRVFLFFIAGLWFLSGLYAQGYHAGEAGRYRLWACFLLTMTGNLGLAMAGDAVSFYLFFALMSFAAYGLVVYHADAEAFWAGRVYIVLVVVGELMLFIGILLAASAAGTLELAAVRAAIVESPARGLILALLLAGFGIKAGSVPLHVWLPLAHPAAPTPASAVLSGAMIKAGLLGWLRFLPLGEAALPEWGWLCILAGFSATFYAILVGLTQTNPKTVLAYSSISQMGLMNIGVGAALLAPEHAPVVVAAVTLYALHHGLAKGSLFLGVGVASAAGPHWWGRALVGGGLLLPALALAGAPLTSGGAAKIALKGALEAPILHSFAMMETLLSIGAVGTTLLMARFLFVTWPRPGRHDARRGLALPWLMLLGTVALIVWVLPWPNFPAAAQRSISPAYVWSILWPVLVGAGTATLAWAVGRKLPRRAAVQVPPGDVLLPVLWALWELKRAWLAHGPVRMRRWAPVAAFLLRRWWRHGPLATALVRGEMLLSRWSVAGLFVLALAAALAALLLMP